MLAKRVLREVCIMRRLIHPYIISLTDVFTSKNLEKPDSTDLYIATEFAECGDMYHQREPMTAETIRTLIWQLLVAVNFMHSCHVWHRDIKSENVLLTGSLQAKLCDFGLSRSALETSSYMDAKPTTGRKKKPVLTRQYTKTVVTPSHRAPEVVMSQGQYTSAIDLWSVGCIFWELLVRESHPNHRGPLTKPLFGVRGEPTTPLRGESYISDISSELHEQVLPTKDVFVALCGLASS
jgi:mitogen-activated protein kinase 1/3